MEATPFLGGPTATPAHNSYYSSFVQTISLKRGRRGRPPILQPLSLQTAFYMHVVRRDYGEEDEEVMGEEEAKIERRWR